MRRSHGKHYAVIITAFAAAVALAAFRGGDVKGLPKAEQEKIETTVTDQVLPLKLPKEDKLFIAVWIPYMAFDCSSEDAFKRDYLMKLEDALEVGANAVFAHVRPFADSFYASDYEPWSHVLTGTQGEDPGYDPLQFMVEQAHSAGMEFHAWINPLRIATANTASLICDDSFYTQTYKERPYCFMEYEGAIYYNPAEEKVRERIASAAAEIVERYDVDGIHIDDYFYPAENKEIDAASYSAYLEQAAHPMSLQEWRTANIHMLVASIYRRVKQSNPKVRFGISPQGNIQNNLKINADIYTWCAQSGYIDYICPQLYYPLDGGILSFEEALQSWKDVARHADVHLYIGLALYKVGTNADSGAWSEDGKDIERQIELSFESGVGGIALYEVQSLKNKNLRDDVGDALAQFMQ